MVLTTTFSGPSAAYKPNWSYYYSRYCSRYCFRRYFRRCFSLYFPPPYTPQINPAATHHSPPYRRAARS